MSVKYSIIERGNPGDATKPKKFYAQAIADGEVSLKELATCRSNQHGKLYRYFGCDHGNDGSDSR